MSVRLTVRRRAAPQLVQVFVKTLTGKTIIIRAALMDAVAACMLQVQAREGIPLELMRLIVGGRQMQYGASCGELGRAG
jgi:hypothetical protein